ncbi:hypothetical protein K491DRAFT_782917 [Lophiostoma macrostomum CBS 122681]|uniref:FAD-binding domain-containing protein n=1 Tax=Lophiostoma macrostomum CBS 122681 TaxID=1314788 RepID=A0A6A6SR42_9PLEO|nr:hypothetical protein K491DRAFT_782917 [Lophiostoma macrostomum CBS 122681]
MAQDELEIVEPVIIVGGGPIGLTCSILLSIRGVPNKLYERHASTSIHPKACGINQRTTEVFRVMGVEDEVYAHATPAEIAGRTAWYTSLGNEGREVISRDAWGGGQYEAEYAAYSPSRYCILPQIRLEPILKRRAIKLNPTGIHSYHEVLAVDNRRDFTEVTVQNRETNKIIRRRARYVIIADGGRQFTDKLGINWDGEANLTTMISTHIRAPIRPLHPDNRNFMTWFTNPAMGGSTRTGYLYQLGPWPEAVTNPKAEEWMFVCGITEDDPQAFDEETALARAKKTIGIPDLEIELLSLTHWTVNAIYASKWRADRCFLLGDSAHRIPPWGALGMNTGIQDAQNLIWKLCLALKDPQKYDALLDTYYTERAEVGKRVGQTSLQNMRSHSGHIDAAIGINTNQTSEQNIAAAKSFFDPEHPDYARKRTLIEAASHELDTEFKAPGYEVGWFYPSADVNSEGGATHGGQQLPDGTLVHHTYYISTIPGHHLPHAWLAHDGKTVAIRDLLNQDIFTLFVEAGNVPKIADDRVQVIAIGSRGWHDVNGTWKQHRGVDATGGVLIRPDGIVAWRGELASAEQIGWTHLLDTLLKVVA